jgi:rhodanese-related sulfurtransferase
MTPSSSHNRPQRFPLLSTPLRQAVFLLLLSLIVGVIWNHHYLLHAWDQPSQTTNPFAGIPLPAGLEQVRLMRKDGSTLFIDARPIEQFQQGHIVGARSLPLAESASAIPPLFREVPPTRRLVIYCSGNGCSDSHELAARLMAAGYSSVFVYEGGFPEWQQQGLPIARGRK